jgi:hypothetical protein
VNIPAIAYVNLTSFLLPPAAGLSRRRALTRPMRLLTLFVVYTLVNEYAMFALALNSVNNLWMLHVYTLVELLFLAAIFLAYPGMRKFRTPVIVATAAYALYWIVSKAVLESFDGFDKYSAPPANILMILVALLALYVASQSLAEEIWRTSFFWFSAAVLVKFVGDFTLFVFADWISALRTLDVLTVWSIHWIMSTIVNILYSVALLCPPPTQAPTGS